MNIYIKSFIYSIAVFLFGVLSTSSLYAATDITLEDDQENKRVSVNIKSNQELIIGVDMEIVYSDDITINKVLNSEDYCTLVFNNRIDDNTVSIECLNNSNMIIEDSIAVIEYSSTSEDYFFYINQNNIDVGESELGEITHINKPEEVSFDSENSPIIVEDSTYYETTEEDSTTKSSFNISTFLNNNWLYLSLGVLLITLIIIFVFLLKKQKEKTLN